MADQTKDVWVYAANKVANKGVFNRIAHSGKFHSVRSAFNSGGSFGSKAIGALTAVGRASLGLIPIPVIGSLLSIAQSAIEGKIRAHVHQKHIDGKTATDPDFIKFSLKEASVENLDRYRFKVEHSVAECNKALVAWGATKQEAEKSKGRCNAKLELAMAIEQVKRRMDIFDKSVLELETLMRVSREWSLSLRAGLNDKISDAKDDFTLLYRTEQDLLTLPVSVADKEMAAATMKAYHSNCSDFCILKGNSHNTTWDSMRRTLADITREVSSPLDAGTLLSLNNASFKSANQLENYESS